MSAPRISNVTLAAALDEFAAVVKYNDGVDTSDIAEAAQRIRELHELLWRTDRMLLAYDAATGISPGKILRQDIAAALK